MGYQVQVSAESTAGSSVFSEAQLSTPPGTVPDQVDNVSVTGLDRALDVMWDVPGNGGAVITTFNVYWGVNNVNESSRRVSHGGTSTTASYTIGDLDGNTTYQIVVSAVNVEGEGGRSEVSTARTPISVARAPSIDGLDLSVGHVLTVRWTKPADNGGAAITSYVVSWMNVGSDVPDEGSDSTTAGVTDVYDY